MLKWKDVPAHILELGNKRAKEQNKPPLELFNSITRGFIWADTPEGQQYWADINNLNSYPVYEVINYEIY